MHELDLVQVAKSFGFSVPPKVHLAMETTKARRGQNSRGGKAGGAVARQQASGHAFSASNPYGQKAAGDARQFSH